MEDGAPIYIPVELNYIKQKQASEELTKDNRYHEQDT